MSTRQNEPTPTGAPQDGLVLDDDDSSELREIFSTIFPQYLMPLEELIGQLLDGHTSPEILDGLRAAVSPLAGAASSIGVQAISAALAELEKVIAEVGQGELDEARRTQVIDVFYRLKETVHEVGMTESAPTSGSGFVKALGEIDGIGSVQVQAILAAGITSAAQLRTAKVDEIAAVTGLAEPLARRLHEAFAGEVEPPQAGADERQGGKETPTLVERESAAAEELRARSSLPTGCVELISVVRERVRLNEMIKLEMAALHRARALVDEMSRTAASLKRRVDGSRAELEHEQEAARRLETELERLDTEIDKAAAAICAATESASSGDFDGLQARVNEIRDRVEERVRGGRKSRMR